MGARDVPRFEVPVTAEAPRSGTVEEPVPTTGGPDPATRQAPPSRRSALLRSAFIVGVLLVVFGIIIPQFVDYQDVIDAFRSLTLEQALLMTGLGAVAWLVGGLKFLTLVMRLTLLKATAVYLILIGIGASVPFGPWNMGVVWVVMRSWRISNEEATSGLALYGIVDQLSRLVLPALATVLLFAAGGLSGIFDRAGIVTAISLIAFVVVGGLILAIVRSDRAADWLGQTGQRIVSSISRRLGRAETADINGAVHRFRDQLGEVVRVRGLLALFVSILFQLTWAGVLIAALRIMGVDNRALSVVEIFAVFAMVQVITILPISPGGAGVPELLYIAGLSTIAGAQYEAAITAGVFLFRIYNWFLPIPLAWILLKVTRRGMPALPSTSEIRSYAHGDAA
jgi:uncharacterized membrane protein YbhN (UPF0104 family)